MQSIVHRLFWGIVVVTIGVVFLLNQTGLISMDIGDLFSTYWPVFVILFGLQGLLLQQSRGFWWNSITVLIGCYFLGRNLDWFEWEFSDFIRIIGPIAIILFGLRLIFRGNRTDKTNHKEKAEQWNPINPSASSIPPMPPGPPPAPQMDEFEPHNPPNPTYKANPTIDTDPASTEGWKQKHKYKYKHEHSEWWKSHDWHNTSRDNHSRFIGDVHLGNDYWELRPMSISHFIGDTTLDLTKAQIPIGETRIYVSSFIGDVKVFAPNDLGVGLQVVSSCLIGDVKVLDQKRGGMFNQMSVETPNYVDSDKRVVLIVSSFIGDVRVTKVG